AFAVFATFAINRMGMLNNQFIEVIETTMPKIASVKDVEIQVMTIRNGYRSHLLWSDAEGKAAAERSIDKARKALAERSRKFKLLNPSEREKQMLAEVEAAVESYVATGARVLELSKLGDVQGAN